jgi:hypothetical protein
LINFLVSAGKDRESATLDQNLLYGRIQSAVMDRGQLKLSLGAKTLSIANSLSQSAVAVGRLRMGDVTIDWIRFRLSIHASKIKGGESE